MEEIVVWSVPVSVEFREGLRYRLALAHPETNRIAVLFDNHAPKGHHQHRPDGEQIKFELISLERLMNDFRHAVNEILEGP